MRSEESWHFRRRSAATLERVVPISLREEVEGEFTVALTSMELYGEAGCILHYLLDVYSMNIAEGIDFGPENFRGEYLWSDTDPIFAVRDQTGREYEVSLGSSSGGTWGDGNESNEGSLEIEPFSPEAAEITVELKETVRKICYRDQPELAASGDEERFVEKLWTGPLSLIFEVGQERAATIENPGGLGMEAAMLKRVIPALQRFEAKGEFIITFASLEDYGESGCVIRYALDLFRPDLKKLPMTGPETGQPVHISNVEPEFEIRDESGYVYDPAMSGGSSSTYESDDVELNPTEFRHAHSGFEALRPEAESLTVELKRLVRTARYHDFSPGGVSEDEAEEMTDVLWDGSHSFTFSVR